MLPQTCKLAIYTYMHLFFSLISTFSSGFARYILCLALLGMSYNMFCVVVLYTIFFLNQSYQACLDIGLIWEYLYPPAQWV